MLVPVAVPRFQLDNVAWPVPSVMMAVVGLMIPPPAVTANATLTPETGFPWESVTRIDGGVTAAPTVSEPGSVLAAAIFAAGPAVAVATKVTDPAVDDAVSVSLFAAVPKV